MALPYTGVIEVRTTGSDTQCAGGFNSARGGTDYSQRDTAIATGTVTSSTTTVTATTGIFTAAMVGNYITDGTTVKEITAYTSSTVVTVDSAPSWTSATIYVGGGLASPGKAAAVAILAGNEVWQREGDYPITTTSANVSGGVVSLTTAVRWRGYKITRGDNIGSVVLRASGISTATLFTIGASAHNCCTLGLTFDGASLSGVNGFSTGSGRGVWRRLIAKNCVAGLAGVNFSYCYAQSCSGVGIGGLTLVDCEAKSCGVGFNATTAVRCIAWNNTGDGFGMVSGTQFYINCVSRGNGGYGFINTTSSSWQHTLINCIAANNTNAGFYISTNMSVIKACASYSNGSANAVTANAMETDAFITLSADPFVNAAAGNFALNNTAGGGAACRAAGIPGAFPGGLTTGYLDIGAVQHQETAAVSSPTGWNSWNT